MSWRDDARTQPPPTPERAPDLTDFLRVTKEKCFNAQELIEEDLLCYFKFSGKKVQLVGDLGERMSKAEMLRALKEKKADPEGASRSLNKGKRKSTEEGGEKRKKRHHEKKARESDRVKVSGETTKEPLSSGDQNPEQQTNETSYEYLDASNISFVAKPSGSVSLDFTRRLISDQDYDLALVWSGSVANRLIRAREEITKTKHSMDEMLESHEGLMKQLVEIRANNDKEKEKMALALEASRANAQSSKAEALLAEEKNKALQAEALAFFEKGFDGCLAQFRESGYTEEEHSAPFLDVERALAAMSNDEDAEESNFSREEAPPA
ncbi:hypothetical protein F511_42668 [Dorcoceras hygrometricum]|uniref:Uncharacterized protein n=1 Tax=Dorcoceras hygrometricum TaxID=472368 RepID=A0A2Z7C6P9_9LAMI|nr:hypothetical protein F511_42668 [Dorcoceras hygrometricum]